MEEITVTNRKKPGLFKMLFGLNQEVPGIFFPALSLVYIAVFYLLWVTMFPSVIPRPVNIYTELIALIKTGGMLFELGSTLKLVFLGMLYSIIISATISFSGKVFNFMRPISEVMPYFRFWSTLGFAPAMRVLAGGGGSFQITLLMFGVVPFLVTSFNSALRDVHKDPLFDYARTLGYSEWRCTYYVIIRSKLVKLYIEIRNVFAVAWVMAPFAEIANRDSGGIGAMIFDKTRFVPGEDPYAASFALNLVVLLCGVIADFLFLRLILTLKEERARYTGFRFRKFFKQLFNQKSAK